MSWICSGCNRESHHIRTVFEDGVKYEYCHHSDCGKISSCDASIPDVYWPGYSHTNQNLCDPSGKPYLLTSRSEKARIMKELNVREAGDRIHGSLEMPKKSWEEGTREYRMKQFDKNDRPMIRKAYKEWLDKSRSRSVR